MNCQQLKFSSYLHVSHNLISSRRRRRSTEQVTLATIYIIHNRMIVPLTITILVLSAIQCSALNHPMNHTPLKSNRLGGASRIGAQYGRSSSSKLHLSQEQGNQPQPNQSQKLARLNAMAAKLRAEASALEVHPTHAHQIHYRYYCVNIPTILVLVRPVLHPNRFLPTARILQQPLHSQTVSLCSHIAIYRHRLSNK